MQWMYLLIQKNVRGITKWYFAPERDLSSYKCVFDIVQLCGAKVFSFTLASVLTVVLGFEIIFVSLASTIDKQLAFF